MVPAHRAHNADIITIEGLKKYATDLDLISEEEFGRIRSLQQAFVDAGAIQCGYCIPGFVMAGAKLLEEQSNPTQYEIEQALTGNFCRCTGYFKIIEAIAGQRSQKDRSDAN
jgi:aerobic-type carbon monoxide dehydrogenase small subunit (CoxS/CutS family)